MADPVVWPYDVLTPAAASFDSNPRTLRGSATSRASSQVVVSSAGIWSASYSRIPLKTPQQIKCWRALDILLQGRSTPLLVPVRDRADRLPLPSTAGGVPLVTVGHSDGSRFSDGSGYGQDTITAELDAGAALYATTVAIRMITDTMPDAGQHFSIGHRLYRISRIVAEEDGVSTVKIWPPLREAVTSGDAVNFSDPVCKMRLASDTEMAADLSVTRNDFGAVAFIEDTF
jgi:hypothetical protein